MFHQNQCGCCIIRKVCISDSKLKQASPSKVGLGPVISNSGHDASGESSAILGTREGGAQRRWPNDPINQQRQIRCLSAQRHLYFWFCWFQISQGVRLCGKLQVKARNHAKSTAHSSPHSGGAQLLTVWQTQPSISHIWSALSYVWSALSSFLYVYIDLYLQCRSKQTLTFHC